MDFFNANISDSPVRYRIYLYTVFGVIALASVFYWQEKLFEASGYFEIGTPTKKIIKTERVYYTEVSEIPLMENK